MYLSTYKWDYYNINDILYIYIVNYLSQITPPLPINTPILIILIVFSYHQLYIQQCIICISGEQQCSFVLWSSAIYTIMYNLYFWWTTMFICSLIISYTYNNVQFVFLVNNNVHLFPAHQLYIQQCTISILGEQQCSFVPCSSAIHTIMYN